MTQEEKDKKEEQVFRQPAQPAVLPQYAEQTAEAVEAKRRREEGGIYAQLQQRLQTATQNRDRAARRWRDSYEKTGDVMRSFVPKPKDTGDEQRRLKRIALGQAIGQLVGALGAGVVGATTEGWTPAASPAGLYNPAAARLQQLREQEDRDIRDYNNLMAKIQQSLAAGDQAVAEQEFIKAAGDVTNLEELIADIAQARLREEGLTKRQELINKSREEQAAANNETRIKVAETNAAAKGSKGGSSSKAISQQDVVDYIPKDRQSQSNGVLDYIPEEIYDYAQDPSDENDIDTTFRQRRALLNRQGNTASYSPTESVGLPRYKRIESRLGGEYPLVRMNSPYNRVKDKINFLDK